MQMVGLVAGSSSSLVGGGSTSKRKRVLIVTGVIAAGLLVIVAIVVAILCVKAFNGATGLQVSHASPCVCLNGGTCIFISNETGIVRNNTSCLCPDSYTGDMCESAVDTDFTKSLPNETVGLIITDATTTETTLTETTTIGTDTTNIGMAATVDTTTTAETTTSTITTIAAKPSTVEASVTTAEPTTLTTTAAKTTASTTFTTTTSTTTTGKTTVTTARPTTITTTTVTVAATSATTAITTAAATTSTAKPTTSTTTTSVTAKTTTSTQPGVYWLQLVVRLPANTSTYTKLNGIPYPTAIYTTTTNYPADTVTTDTIQYVASASSLAVTSQSTPNTAVNSIQYGTSLISFSLTSVMATHVHFSVRLATTQKIQMPYPALVKFDQIVSTSALWAPPSNSITVTYTGAYFISLTIEVPAISATYVLMMVNQAPKAMLSVTDFNMTSKSTIKNGIMSGRTACMLQLNVNDILTSAVYNMWAGTDLYGSPDGVTNMQAFLYSPQPAIGTPVAWSVASSAHFITYQWPTGIVAYDLVKVNIGNAWYSVSSAAVIPVSGTYLIDVTSCLAEAYYCGNGKSGTQLMVNGKALFTLKLYQPFKELFGSHSRSRSIIVSLNVGDTVYVRMLSDGGCLAGFSASPNWFVGMRLY